MSIGERIKFLRKKHNHSQKDLGMILGKKQVYISEIESNKSNLTIESLITICENYNVSADWILFGCDLGTELEKKYRLLNELEKTHVDMILNSAAEREEVKKVGNL